MRFELTPEIIDQIIFSMENQETPFIFDSSTRTVVDAAVTPAADQQDADEGVGTERFVEIPVWSSADGFQLMERFVATLRNPLARERLRAALSGGKGVFRNFKNALKEHEEVERLWFSFKDREMRIRVVDWYNDLCDLWGWVRLSREPDEEDETDELVLSDFEFLEEGTRGVDLVRAYDREAWEEALSEIPPPIVDSMFARARAGVDPEAENSIIISARTPSGEFAGFVWGIEEGREEEGDESANLVWLWLAQIYVTREFRGLGIAKALVQQICRAAYARGVHKVFVDLFGSAEVLTKPLSEEGFKAISHSLMLDLEEWGFENAEQ